MGREKTGRLWSAPVADVIAMSVTAAVVARVWKGLKRPDVPTAEQ